MDTNLITRRAAFATIGAAVSTLALAPVAVAAVAPDVTGSMSAAIRAHRVAYRRYSKATDLVCDIEDSAGIEYPKVQTGLLNKGYDAAGEKILEPIYSYTHDQIDEYYSEANNPWFRWHPPGPALDRLRATTDARREAAHQELTRATRRYRRAARACGLTAAVAADAAASKVEAHAMLALVLTRPTTAAEADAKRRYVKRAAAFRDGWHEVLLPQILDALSTVEA